jgi:hypothetical protein
MTEICPERKGAGIIEKWSYLLAGMGNWIV